MKLLIKQEHAVYYLRDKETTEILYGGAAGGGKSALGCLWLIEMCQKYAGSRWLMGRSKLKTLKETTLNTFFEQATNLGITNQYRYNASEHIIYFHNGSQILLKDLFLYPSDPNFDSLGSLEICGAFIDEVNQVTELAWQVVKSRCRYKLEEFGLIPKILGSCNPAKNWVYREFYKAWKDKVLKSYRKFVQALPTDNPHLPQAYLTALLQMNKNSKERLYYGNWEYDDDPTVLIDLDSITDYFNTSIVGDGRMYLTIDVARQGKDKTVFRVWNGWLCVHREAMAKSSIPEVVNRARELMKGYGVAASNTIADEDGVGGGVVDYLKCNGFVNNSKAIEEIIAGKSTPANYKNLKSQCSFIAAKKITDKLAGELTTDPQVIEDTAAEMEQIRQDDIDTDSRLGIVSKDQIKERLGRSPDDWDSIMMRAYFDIKPPSKVRRSYTSA